MIPRYRRDYTGEFVLLETRIANGKTEQRREWIPNPIENHHISGRAAVIGSRIDQDRFQHQRLQRHKGGLLATKRLQTYGTGDLWTDMFFDFFVVTGNDNCEKLIKSNYTTRSTVYTSANLCIDHPGYFYPVPFLPVMDVLGLAVYLAAFDGHREIFLIGYNKETPAGQSSWTIDVNQTMGAYPGTQFILVGTESNMPEIWKEHANVRCMDFRKFVSYCDV